MSSRYAPHGEPRSRVLQLSCVCGRNLAVVRFDKHNADFTVDGLQVVPNLNVEQEDFRPWPHSDPGADMHARTYSWTCRCRRPVPPMRHERVSAIWNTFNDDPAPWTKSRWRYVVNG